MFNDKTLLLMARHIGVNYSLRQAKELFVEIGLSSGLHLAESALLTPWLIKG